MLTALSFALWCLGGNVGRSWHRVTWEKVRRLAPPSLVSCQQSSTWQAATRIMLPNHALTLLVRRPCSISFNCNPKRGGWGEFVFSQNKFSSDDCDCKGLWDCWYREGMDAWHFPRRCTTGSICTGQVNKDAWWPLFVMWWLLVEAP